MLRLRHQDNRYDYDEARRGHQRRIRQQELQAMFKTIRRSLLLAEVTQPNPEPIPVQQLPPNYHQYLSYVLQIPQIQPLLNLPHIVPQPLQKIPSAAQPLILPVRNSPQPNVYFRKNGIVVYRTQLGRGTYSRVWQGLVEATGEAVAVKQVKTLQPSEEKCLRELHSQHIIRVIDIFPHAGKSCIVLELCQRNLRDELTHHQFEIRIALGYFEQLVEGMQVLQQANIIHRDLKFENILIRQGYLKIADFGLAKFLGDQLEVESRRCGTPYTMAPEIYFCMGRRAPYTVKSDLWAMGVILHEMLYKQHPFGCSSKQFQQKQRVALPPKFGVLDRLIDRCLVFSPEMRIDWLEFNQIFKQYLSSKKNFTEQIEFPHFQEESYEREVAEQPFAKKKRRFYMEQQEKPLPISIVRKQFEKKRVYLKEEERTPSRIKRYHYQERQSHLPILARPAQNPVRRRSPFSSHYKPPKHAKDTTSNGNITAAQNQTKQNPPLSVEQNESNRVISIDTSKYGKMVSEVLVLCVIVAMILIPLF